MPNRAEASYAVDTEWSRAHGTAESWSAIQAFTAEVGNSSLPWVARLLLLTLAFKSERPEWIDRSVVPAFAELERWTGLARSTVAEYIIAIERAGWLDRRPAVGGALAVGGWVLRVGDPTCIRRETIPPEVRARVFSRDSHACRRCSRTTDLTIDHVVPYAAGGSDDEANLQTLCRRCNSRKGASLTSPGV